MPGRPEEKSLSRRRVCGQPCQRVLNGQMIMRTKPLVDLIQRGNCVSRSCSSEYYSHGPCWLVEKLHKLTTDTSSGINEGHFTGRMGNSEGLDFGGGWEPSWSWAAEMPEGPKGK